MGVNKRAALIASLMGGWTGMAVEPSVWQGEVHVDAIVVGFTAPEA